jgi:hypothetical protein
MRALVHATSPLDRGIGAAALLAATLGLASCGIDRVGDSFSGGASMQVEVEVYKGPLSKEPEVQWGEFEALVGEAAASLASFNDHVLRIAINRGYLVPKPKKDNNEKVVPSPLLTIKPHFRGDRTQKQVETRTVAKIGEKEARHGDKKTESDIIWCNSPRLRASLVGSLLDRHYINCLHLAQLHDDVQHLTKTNQTLKNDIKKARPQPGTVDALDVLREGAEVGTQFKVKAFYWAETQMIDPPTRWLRLYMSTFANLAAEFGNQIASRADTLLKQCRNAQSKSVVTSNCSGMDRERLPLSVYLREVNPTEFANLFVHNRAGGLPIWEEVVSRPPWELGREDTRDRVRVIERLFADHNWSRINTVYASGQGDVRMAFIKDDIGNWNLKSFSNDPGELLSAYSTLTRAAVSAVASAASGGGGASGALALAGRIARGRVSPASTTAGGVDLTALSSAVGRQLDIIADRRKKAELAEAKPKSATPEQRAEARRKTYREMRTALEQYDALLESLQSAVTAPATGDPPGARDQLNRLTQY